MNIIELLEHVTDNLKNGRDAGEGLMQGSCPSIAVKASDIVFIRPETYTLAPRTHKVNGWEVAAPESEMRENGSVYFVPDHGNDAGAIALEWLSGSRMNERFLKNKQVFLTKEAAIQNQKAQAFIDPFKGGDM